MTAEPSSPQWKQRWTKFRTSFKRGLRHDWALYCLFIVGVMTIAAMIVSITGMNQITTQNDQLKRLAECQNSYNEINNERTRRMEELSAKESRAAARADEALSKLVDAMTSGSSREELTRLVEDLNKGLDAQAAANLEAEKERKARPVPPPPRALCGDVPD